MKDSNFAIYRTMSLFCGAVVFTIGTMVIWGWTNNVLLLADFNPNWVAMKVNAALSFILIGLIIFCLLKSDLHSNQTIYHWLARIFSFTLILLGTFTCIEYLFTVDLHIDQLFWKQTAENTHLAPVGRMAPITAIMLINYGIALFLLSLSPKKAYITVAQCGAFIGGILGILVFISYIFGAKELYEAGHFTAIAAPTALGFIFASLSILCLRPKSALMQTFTSSTGTGQILRQFLPLALFTPIVVGWLRLKGEESGFYNFNTGLAIFATASIAICEICIFWITRKFQKIELRLSQREQLLSAQAELLNLTNDAIMMVDLDDKIIFWNAGASFMYGYSQNEAVGQISRDLLRSTFSAKWQDIKSRALENGKWEGEVTNFNRNGSSLTVASRWSLKKDENGKPIAILQINNDISANKETEQRVSEFYSMISHELRTPITSMKGVFSILDRGRAGELSERAKQLVTMGMGETERLIRLINNILDIKKLEAGKFELIFERIEPKQLVEKTISAVTNFAAQYQVELVSEIQDNDTIKGDKDSLTQILTNLISNAVKFSDEGQAVTIAAIRNNGNMRFSVIDRGPGIATANVSKLFRMFQQVGSEDRSKGGTGLGLAICKSMVEQHGGKIGIDTEEGKGSTFWFEIPCIPDIE